MTGMVAARRCTERRMSRGVEEAGYTGQGSLSLDQEVLVGQGSPLWTRRCW